MRQKRENYPMRVKLLKIALEMYLEKGFTFTTNQMIVKKAQCSPGELTHFFGTKENILYEVVRIVLPFHQETLAKNATDGTPADFRYCLEIAVEIAMCEQSETIKDLYVNAYTLPKIMEFIRVYSYKKSVKTFSERLPGWTEQDFYETEALNMGIVFASLMNKCNPRYNIIQKIGRTLDALLKMYEYTKEERDAIIQPILGIDIEQISKFTEEQMRKSVEEILNKG